jgi:hypothetical protein
VAALKWTNRGGGLWTTAWGWGEYGVQYGRQSKTWYVEQRPFIGNPVILGHHKDKAAAMREVQAIYENDVAKGRVRA